MMRRMKLGRKNDAAVQKFRHLVTERDAALAEARKANDTIDGLMTDLAGCTLVAVGCQISYSPVSSFGVYRQITAKARLKQLTPHGRLVNLGEVSWASSSCDPAIEDRHSGMPVTVAEGLGAEVFKKVLANCISRG